MTTGCARIGSAGEVELTREGRLIALRVIRRHRLVECLLVGVLGLEADLVDVEASKLAHVITERVERRLYEMLGRPQMTPSGARIPGLAELR